jgi:hypothetical protein
MGATGTPVALSSMSVHDALHKKIHEFSLPLETRCAIVNNFWDCSFSVPEYSSRSENDEVYFRYYQEQCRVSVQSGSMRAAATTHNHISEIIRHFKNPKETRESIQEKLRGILPTHHLQPSDIDEVITSSIDLAVRLWLMLYVGNLDHCLVPGQSPICWSDSGLDTLVSTRFSTRHDLNDPVKLEKAFNARNLERIAGIQVLWTDNLADHLSLRDDDTRVAIFHHASFLEYHKNWYTHI